jgi:steroid delta-isomerase-like uncharacterized protein
MATDNLKQLYQEYIEAIWHQRDLAAMDRYFTEDTVDHAAPPGQAPGLAGLKVTFAMIQEAFPDWHITIEDMIVEGDKLVARMSVTGTHRGPFFGIPATGRRIATSGTHTLRYAGGKLAEHWSHSDDLRMMQQLGVVQMPGQ